MSPDAGGTPMAALVTDVTALRVQAGALRAQVEATPTPTMRVGQLTTWAATRDRIRQSIIGIHPTDLFAGLDAQVPLALLPVRLETRFAEAGTDVLHVRIYPDDLHVDGHDPELTTLETSLGSAMWAAPADLLVDGETAPADAPPTDSATGRRAFWSSLVTLLGGPRAAWVAQATRPGGTGPTAKPQAYIRPAVARALPDRWLVRAYVGEAVVAEAWTTAVGVDLHLGPDPQAVPDPAAAAGGLPPIDPEMRWLIDYATALGVGMAVDLTLPAGTQSVDRVVVVGVRATSTPADAATELAGLLTAHRYTDGFGFLPVGSPTANNPDARSVGDRHTDPIALWQQEFGAPARPGTAAAIVASGLGLPAGVVDGSMGSSDAGDAQAVAMQTATWAATWGYYLGELLDASNLGPTEVDQIRAHYLVHVRGRGTQPTLRIGKQPYGVLPLLPLSRWTTDGASPLVDRLARLLTSVRPLWQYGVGQPVTASEGPGFDDAFTRVMSTDAVARGYSIRSVIADRTFNPVIFTGVDPTPGNGVIDAMISGLLGLDSNPLILDVFSPTAQPVRAPMVVDPTDKTPDATVRAAIRSLSGANPRYVLLQPVWLTPRPDSPATLLHTLLRRSLLLEYANAGVTLGSLVSTSGQRDIAVATAAGTLTDAGAAERVREAAPVGEIAKIATASSPTIFATTQYPAGMLVGLSPDPNGGFTPVTTRAGIITTATPSITGSMATGEWLWRNTGEYLDVRRSLDQTLAALDLLATLTADQLEILLPETLDLATHRWTAWAESVAADKLARLRAATPTGITLGGWGAVQRVSRRPRVAVDPALSAGASAGPLWEDVRPGGFVHAPSTAQAATAAVLRAAHLAHGGEDDPTCAVDLSSARARVATRLADGVRGGQELGALLGYEVELDLHQRGADVLVAPLRAYAPRWQASGTFVEGDPTEIVSPSAVVDGLALAAADPATVAAKVIPAGSPASLATSLAAALSRLRDHQDALADLLTAEAVHHVLAGNTARAAAVLDAAGRGGLPPAEFEVLRTPRSGLSLTCRLAVLLPDAPGALPGGWPPTVRGAADVACAAWLASVLPPLSRLRLRVADMHGQVTDVALPAAAGIGPLDLVLDQPDVLGTRLLLALPAGSSLVPDRGAAWTPVTVSFEELLTAAGDLREVVASRALRRADLWPSTSTPAPIDERDAADLQARVAAARTVLVATAADVTAVAGPLQSAITAAADASALTDAARAALGQTMACGIVIQLPTDPAPADLLAALGSASAELARRLSAAAPGAGIDDLTAALKGLLGAGQPAIPRLLVDADTAAVAATGLAAGDGYLAKDPELAADWVADMAGVRAGAGRLAAAVQDCDALAAGAVLPEDWRILEPGGAGTAGAGTTAAPPAWTATLGAHDLTALGPATTVVLRAAPTLSLPAGSSVSGLLVDEWVEVVPQPVANTAVTYQAEAPAARAPQAILLGVAPNVAAGWDVDTVVDLVREALDLAGLRTVDAETGAWFGRMLPAVLLPDGDATDVIDAPSKLLLEIEATVLEASRLQAKELG